MVDLARYQVQEGWEVAVACPGEGDLAPAAAAAGADVLGWRASRSPGPAVAAETASLGRIVRAAAPDLVHLHSTRPGSPAGWRCEGGCRRSTRRTRGPSTPYRARCGL